MTESSDRRLRLYSRTGCCLCEGLEQRLRQLDLVGLSLELVVIDIDASDLPPAVRARYDLEVPVLSWNGRDLPRVSPRLSGEGLFNWLQRALSNTA